MRFYNIDMPFKMIFKNQENIENFTDIEKNNKKIFALAF